MSRLLRKKVYVVGAGPAGCVLSEQLASKNYNVILIEKREHIGGNCHDYYKKGSYIQKYGPHIFHTNDKIIWDYLSKFTSWHKYTHEVLAKINKKFVNIPFNINSIETCFKKDEAGKIIKILKEKFGKDSKIPILELNKDKNEIIRKLSKYVYENVFLNYTLKQWDMKPEELDSSVTGRVPVFVSRDNRYFQDSFQGIPSKGFNNLFRKMIQNKNITIILNKKFKLEKKTETIFYTGAIDELFNNKFGKIKYRRIYLNFEEHKKQSYQINSVINYPNEKKYTRITEFNKFLSINQDKTIIAKEYPSWKKGFLAYPLQTKKNKSKIKRYMTESRKYNNLYLVGRLSEGKYYNIDEVVAEALKLSKKIKKWR